MAKNNDTAIYRIAVIGGGASGLFAAVNAADEASGKGLKVDTVVYEAGPRVGKKILVTGNGRCNLTNNNMSEEYYRGSRKLFSSVYSRFDKEKTLAFFRNAGLYTKSDFAGRVYPLSSQAASVLDALRAEVRRAGIREVTDTKIISVKHYKSGYMLNSDIYADKVIIACGGKAAPVHGSDGSGYKLLRDLGVEITPLYPALTAMNVSGFTKALKGIRAEGTIVLRSSGKTLASSSGEIQYTDYGLSGIPAMQISRFAASALGEKKEVVAYVDALPSVSEEELRKIFLRAKKHDSSKTTEDVLSGLMPKKLGTYFITQCSVSPVKSIGSVFDNAIEKLITVIKHGKYKISSVRDFSEAQVTAGGVAENEIDGETMELKKHKGLYVCGEIADVDGDCGGYNLQWAFSSGAVAGISSVGELVKIDSYK